MAIDWITVSAQIVNFLILVWLLKRFLYQPVIDAMERREQRIAQELTEVRVREQQADESQQHYRDRADELKRKYGDIVTRARKQAEQEKRQLMNEARSEVAEARRNWRRQTEQEKQAFLEHLQQRATDAIQQIARKALGDLADAELGEQMIDSFINRLKLLDKKSRQKLTGPSGPVRIASAFELDSTVRGRLTRAVHEHIADGIEVDYTQSPELLCGIELTGNGRRLSWNLADYMEELTASIEEAFHPSEPLREKG